MDNYGEHLEHVMMTVGLSVIAIEMDDEQASGDYTVEARVTNRANGKSAIVGYLEPDDETEITVGVYEIWDGNGMNGSDASAESDLANDLLARLS